MPELFFEQKQTRTFAITVGVRDARGILTNKTKTFETDNASQLEEWYERNTYKKAKKKKHGDEEDKPKNRSRRNKSASQQEGNTTVKTG